MHKANLTGRYTETDTKTHKKPEKKKKRKRFLQGDTQKQIHEKKKHREKAAPAGDAESRPGSAGTAGPAGRPPRCVFP